MIDITTVDQLELDGASVFYRVDYNVPVENGQISDTTRIDETLPTLKLLRERGVRIIIGSHMGRPKGKPAAEFSLSNVRTKLSELLGLPVQWSEDATSPDAQSKAKALKPGEILLLENLRFHAGEESNEAAFAATLRKLADFYVNDAFGASHREHASIVALPRLFPRDRIAGGLLLAKELQFLQKITDVEERPFIAILGGAKISGKIEALEALVRLADVVLVGGGMANTFLAAQGRDMGSSLVDKDSLGLARRLLDGSSRAEIILPQDLVITDSLKTPGFVRTISTEAGMKMGEMAVDIGMVTVNDYVSRIEEAQTLFWNGPMGVFEQEQFAAGTRAVAKAFASNHGISVVGGGESVEAVKQSGFAHQISHISTGGGASLEFVAGMQLPGVELLRKGKHAAGN